MGRGWIAVVGLVVGCGPAVDGDGGSAASGDSGASSGAVASEDASTASSDTEGGLCPELSDGHLPNLVVPVEITNTLETAVYIGYESACLTDLFHISRADGSTVNWHGRVCTPSCDQVLAGECFDCGACPETAMLRIGPGATYTYAWTPTEYDMLDFPSECGAAPCSGVCDRQYELADGDYTFELVGSTACDGDGMTCDCHNGEDACDVSPWSWPEPTLSASVDVALPTGTVVLTIE